MSSVAPASQTLKGSQSVTAPSARLTGMDTCHTHQFMAAALPRRRKNSASAASPATSSEKAVLCFMGAPFRSGSMILHFLTFCKGATIMEAEVI